MDNTGTHLVKILHNYLRRENYEVNKEDFRLQLESNPNYPSIKSVTDALDYFSIENIAAKVPKESLNKLPSFFLAIVKNEEANSIAQVMRTRKTITLLTEEATKRKLTAEEFQEVWDGTIVAIENGNIKKSTFVVSFKNPLIPLFLFVVGTVSFGVISQERTALIYTCLAALGFGLSYLVVQEDLGIYNETTTKICNSATVNTSCSDVITSKSAKLFKGLSLSDLSITFFVSALIIIGFMGYHETFFFGATLLSIPIVLYSVGIQAFSLKQWCPLCLGIVGVLIGLATTSFVTTEAFTYQLSYFSKGLMILGVVYLSWVYLKSLVQKSTELQQVTTDYLKFKRNEDLFSSLLTKKKLSGILDLDEEAEIVFGNPDADLTLTTVTNPTCGYCTDSFRVLDNLLKTHGAHFKLRMIFMVNTQSADDIGYEIAKSVVENYKMNPAKSYDMLNDWYADKNIENWRDKHPKFQQTTSPEILNHHVDWCMANQMQGTPTTLVEDCFFPREYDLKDLAIFMEDLTEDKGKTLNTQEAELA